MLSKGWSFVMMLQGLRGLKWDGWVVFTTIKYGQTVRYIWAGISILIIRSISSALSSSVRALLSQMIGCWAMFSGTFLELVNFLQHA